MRIRKSLTATAVLLALGFSGQGMVPAERGPGDNNAVSGKGCNGNNRDNITYKTTGSCNSNQTSPPPI